ncbi:site-specific integrase [Puia dinghuensis]|uniref:Tyr recombinase domain-containing protein n=1 Tax=Puia dinghuensis TaxID=1792502 RepID=A0A8J2UK34_9BACT|nr:site-specific integrase [Puia dinghuensis]GGB26111.1 hypothetical protein GCM10011511_57600 [Puia dinghuensis]
MYVKQEFSLLFFLRTVRTDKKTGKAPLYYQLKIDGASLNRAVKGIALRPGDWDNVAKLVTAKEPKHQAFNKKISNLRTDLERHFDLIQAKSEIATPQMVLKAYETPLMKDKRKLEKQKNFALSQQVDDFITRFLQFSNKWETAHKNGRTPYPAQKALLEEKQRQLKEESEILIKNANLIFDDKEWEKTVMLGIDELLIQFLQIVLGGERAASTLEKMWGRKNRYVEFLRYRYNVDDIPMHQVEFKLAQQLLTYNISQFKMKENSAMKYVQLLKEVFSRSVSIGWQQSNVLAAFTCHYNDTDAEWLSMDDMIRLKGHVFSRDELNRIRDLYVFASFTGYSYVELSNATQEDYRTGVDGKVWISKDRQKTGSDETLPLLPVALEILEKYKDDPKCRRKKTLLPIPTNAAYNRCLKEIGDEMGFKIKLTTHTARYFFANAVADDNGLELRITAQLMGHKSLRTTQHYVKKNKRLLAANMQNVEDKLYGKDGALEVKVPQNSSEAKVITLRIVR